MAILASSLLAVLQGVIVFCLVYQVMLAVASAWPPRTARSTASRRMRFAIAIPAHDEAAVLPATLARLREQDYPGELFDVHVVADHCADATAEVARQGGAIAHERNVRPRGRKAYALQWLLKRILECEPCYEAVAIFDADSLVDPAFLSEVEGHLRDGKQVLQGQHIISNPHDSSIAAIAAVDMRLNNRLRNQSRSNLGFSCRLMGDAMVFGADVLCEHGWPTASLIEDREFGYELLLRGIRTYYVPQARSYGQAASTRGQVEPQRLRWYRDVPEMQRRFAGRLIAAALRSRSVALLDGALELLVPSYSFLVALSAINLVLVVALGLLLPSVRGLLGVTTSACVLAAWLLYPLVGLWIDRAPGWAYRALFLGPAYLAWRLWISVLVRVRGDRIGWLRTQRREESKRSNR